MPDTDFQVVVSFHHVAAALCMCARTAAVCPPTAACVQQFMRLRIYRRVKNHSLLVQPTIHSSPLALCGEDSSCRFIMHACTYIIERAVPAADIHTVKDCKLYVGREILFPLRLLLRTCVYEPAVRLPYQKHACTYIIYIKYMHTLYKD